MLERRSRSHRLSFKLWLNKVDSKFLKKRRILDKELLKTRFRGLKMSKKLPLKLKRLKD
jgi:hypothetical protein